MEEKQTQTVEISPFSERAAEIVTTLEGYRGEADQARKGGMNPRDDKWTQNLDLYWNRYDFTQKAAWQSKEVMPEVPVAVDRFAAALKEALIASPNGFYTVTDPSDKEGDLTDVIKRMLDAWLTVCGKNHSGHLLGFPAVFEEQAKLGALMACCATVNWKTDEEFGRVSIEAVDPRNVWLDHTYRNLYRIKRTVIDRHMLKDMLGKTDRKGNSIYNLSEMARLIQGIEMEMAREQQERTGTGTEITSNRREVVLDEYIATVLKPDGSVLYPRAVCVVANRCYLIRGPEPIPFWHGKDWMVYSPLIPVPLSPYGRSYMEDLGSIAKTFTELTNLILDAVYASSIRSWVIVPSMLMNPTQVIEGNVPGKLWQLEEGMTAKDFVSAFDAGTLPAESWQLWSGLKNELREGTAMNEIGMGQLAPNSRTSATEISTAQENSSALIRSIAHTIETQWLDPVLDLSWKTGLQHVSLKDPAIRQAAGEEMFSVLMRRRKELIKRPITFQARGISTLIEKGQKLKALLGVLQVLAQNEMLMATFLQRVSLDRLVKVIFDLAGFDMFDLQASEREMLARQLTEPMQQMAGSPPGSMSSTPMQQEARNIGDQFNARIKE